MSNAIHITAEGANLLYFFPRLNTAITLCHFYCRLILILFINNTNVSKWMASLQHWYSCVAHAAPMVSHAIWGDNETAQTMDSWLKIALWNRTFGRTLNVRVTDVLTQWWQLDFNWFMAMACYMLWHSHSRRLYAVNMPDTANHCKLNWLW